jgi:hypothetical protein
MVIRPLLVMFTSGLILTMVPSSTVKLPPAGTTT